MLLCNCTTVGFDFLWFELYQHADHVVIASAVNRAFLVAF